MRLKTRKMPLDTIRKKTRRVVKTDLKPQKPWPESRPMAHLLEKQTFQRWFYEAGELGVRFPALARLNTKEEVLAAATKAIRARHLTDPIENHIVKELKIILGIW